MRVLSFSVQDQRIALPLEQAREVIEHPRITPLPGAPVQLLGLTIVRGDIMPVYDAAQLFGWPATGDALYVVVVDSAGDLAGLAVNNLPETTELGDRVDSSDMAAGDGVFQDDRGMITLVNVETLLGPARNDQWQT